MFRALYDRKNDLTEWRAVSSVYTLPPDEVHVWRIILSDPPAYLDDMRRLLSADERQKADRYHFRMDHARFTVGRAVLRSLLAACLDIRSDDLQFQYGENGKPFVANPTVQMPLEFNVAHSGGIVLIALARGRAVGVDVERMRDNFDTEGVAARFFSLHERLTLKALPSEQQFDAFFSCWTRKEAYLKAIGSGLSLPLDQFDVSFAPGDSPRMVATRPDPAEADRWELAALDVGSQYKAAIVVEGRGWRLKTLDWPPTGPAHGRSE